MYLIKINEIIKKRCTIYKSIYASLQATLQESKIVKSLYLYLSNIQNSMDQCSVRKKIVHLISISIIDELNFLRIRINYIL